MWVKICANTNLDDALMAGQAGADAVGFVFAESPRRLTVAQAAQITPHLPQGLEKIGVFLDATLEQIRTAVLECGLTGVQLHSEAPADLPARIHAEVHPETRILRVAHYGAQAAGQVQLYAADAHVSGILVDSRTATAVGGTGVRFDWSEAGRTLFAKSPLIVAGGLTPENVEEAVRQLNPQGVDVVSGVEMSPGRKNPEKVRAFIARARAARPRTG